VRQLESGRDQLMQEQKQLRELQRALKRQEVHEQIIFSLGSDSLRVGRIHVLPKKKGGLFDTLGIVNNMSGPKAASRAAGTTGVFFSEDQGIQKSMSEIA